MFIKMIVAVKQVPDTQQISGEVMTPDGRVNRSALPTIVNPEDLNALEEALKIKDKFGGKVTVISMGPPSAIETLKECYYRGADDVILISDKDFAGADTLATSMTLKYAIDKIGDFDIVFCGRQAIDGDTAQVGPQLAEKLKINQITRIIEIIKVSDKKKGSIEVKRATEYGYEILKSHFPVLLTITGIANQPRSPDIKRLLAFKNMLFMSDDSKVNNIDLPEKLKPYCPHFKIWDRKSISIDSKKCGLNGSPTKVKKIESIVLTASNFKNIEINKHGINSLINELKKDHIIG